MPRQFETEAKLLVDQHYAAGPERMKEVIADALRDAVRAEKTTDRREQLKQEVADAELASLRGSE